jgi:tetratricopeptide (TPR) repeat protein
VHCHRRAVELLSELPIEENTAYLADLGAAWVNLGCALSAVPAPECREEALAAFESAVDLLGRLPFEANPRFRHNLAAAWMNRADAYAQIGTAAGRSSAQGAYVRAIEIAGELPLDEKPSFRILLGSCWINRGNLHQRTLDFPGAIRAYDGALAALGNLPRSGHRLACHHAATAWVNRGEALFEVSSRHGHEHAVESARMALAHVEGRNLGGPVDAKLNLRALRVLARGLESDVPPGGALSAGKAAELTDVVERGLDLAFGGHENDPQFFDPFIVWFFAFGSRAYGRHQPRFLAEFLDEVLGRWDSKGSPEVAAELRAVARRATIGALEELGRTRLLVAGTRQTELLMSAVKELRAAAFQFNP